MPSLSALLGVGAVTLLSVASANKYTPVDTYPGSSFFDYFDFVPEEKNGGFVKYVDRSRAEEKKYIRYEDGDAIFGVDYESKLNSADGFDPGRESVRLEGKKDYNKGLFVLDVKHMPGGICGTWPAFWSLGREEWPKGGEIDIIEGVNKNSVNTLVLHTDTQCKVNGLGQTGVQALTDCALDTAGTTGCGVSDTRTSSYGTGFNANNGGYYVTEWQAEGIKIWFFPRGSEPKSLTSSEPDTADFGRPAASFQGDCDIEKRFVDHRFIFTNTFCGAWAGNVYAQSGCPMYQGLDGMASCKKYVAEHPEAFKDAYWRVSSFKTFNKRTITSSSSVAPSSTRQASSSSIHASSSTVQTSSSSVRSSSSSMPVSSTSTHASSSSSHVSSSSASVHVSSSSATVSSSSIQASSSSVAHSSSFHTSSSSVHISSSSATVSSSSVQASSSSVAHSSSAVSSSIAHSSSSTSAAPSAHPSSSIYPSSTIVASSSSSYEVSSSVTQDYSSTISASTSETSHDHMSSFSTAHESSSDVNSSASETSSDHVSSSTPTSTAFETSYPHDSSSTVSSVSVSETSYSHDSSSIYPSTSVLDVSSVYPSSSSSVGSVDVSSVYPTETPSANSSGVYPSESPSDSSTVHSSATSSSAHPNVTSADSTSSCTTLVASTFVPVYSVYPEDNENEYPITSSKTAEYEAYPTASTNIPGLGSSSVLSSSSSIYGSELPTYTPIYADYPELPSFTPLYSTYPTISSTPSYGDDQKATFSQKTTTAYETTYVDICPTGYTTITTKVTAIETPALYPTTDAHYAPPRFEVTTKYCSQGCGEGPKTVTVTVPCSKCQAATPLPSKPVHSSVKITATTIITLTKTAVPDNEYSATLHSIASPSVSSIKHPGTNADKTYEHSKPVAPTDADDKVPYPTDSAPVSKPVSPTGSSGSGKPVYPTVIGVPGFNATISYGTVTSAQTKPSQTGYKAPEFTGAADKMQVGGVVACAIGAFAAMMM